MAIGSRTLAARLPEFTVHARLYRSVLGSVFNAAVRQGGIKGISDTQCGFKLFPRDVARELFSYASIDGFGLETAALRVYEAKTGMSDFYERLDREEKDLPPPPPEGIDWDFEDEEELKRRFPRLCHLYLVPPDEEEVAGREG